ncbi:MAG: SH3 domain-containing protein [Clostridia bacterium]|nr:SH3 domain-containing protein [Clostridia bacterium]
MKKILYILLLALVLTGCGNQETDKKTDKVVQSELQGNEETPEAGEESGEEIETIEETPENSTQTPEITQPTVTKTTMYAKSSVNVRSGAGTSHSKVGSLAKGQEVVKIGEENGWSEIEFNGGTGYVNSNYLSTEKVEVSMNNSNTGNSNSSNNNSGSTNTGSNNITPNQNTETTVHEHTWEEVTEEKKVYYAWRTLCGKCGLDMTDLSDDDLTLHTAVICRSRYSTKYIEVDFVTTDYKVIATNVGYKCSCGATKEGTGVSWITDSHITIY